MKSKLFLSKLNQLTVQSRIAYVLTHKDPKLCPKHPTKQPKVSSIFYHTIKYNGNNDQNYNKYFLKSGSALVAFGTAGLLWYLNGCDGNVNSVQAKDIDDELREFGREIKGLKSYTAEEVAKHNEKSKRIWVSFGNGVYDITDFVDKHPGGDKILMASGGALEPFWTLFAVHKNIQVMKLLEKYRIGNLDAKDRTDNKGPIDDPYANEPKRHPALIPRSQKPFNAEPPEELLTKSFLTPKY